MIHAILYTLHIGGMIGIIGFGAYLLMKKDFTSEVKNKFATIFISCVHTQLLTGFLLFFLMMSEVNHMKIGIKMLLAIEIAVMGTIYKKKIKSSPQNANIFLISSLLSAVIVTGIAFLW